MARTIWGRLTTWLRQSNRFDATLLLCSAAAATNVLVDGTARTTEGATVDTLSHTTNPALVSYRNRYPVTEHRGMRVQDIPTDEVQIGDRLCCWLSDASAYPEVTGWSNRELDLGYLGHPIHRDWRSLVVRQGHDSVEHERPDVRPSAQRLMQRCCCLLMAQRLT
jgi:hypothetical protein